jgi:methionyl-tRNA formyltransferase
VAFFGSGSPLSIAILGAIGAQHDVVATVVPRGRPPRKNGLSFRFGSPGFHSKLRELNVDLFCVAAFPHILDAELLAMPRLGAVNAHPSLLPRHRGPDPLFWAYFQNDEETGVTIHWMNERADRGDIVAQIRMPIPRGTEVTALDPALAARGAEAMAKVLDLIATGNAPRAPQNESEATAEPPSAPDNFRVDLTSWPAERVWHFLRGIGCRRSDLLRDEQGQVLIHGTVQRRGSAPSRPAGTIERAAGGYRLHCIDGWLEVRSAPLRTRLRYLLRRLIRR